MTRSPLIVAAHAGVRPDWNRDDAAGTSPASPCRPMVARRCAGRLFLHRTVCRLDGGRRVVGDARHAIRIRPRGRGRSRSDDRRCRRSGHRRMAGSASLCRLLRRRSRYRGTGDEPAGRQRRSPSDRRKRWNILNLAVGDWGRGLASKLSGSVEARRRSGGAAFSRPSPLRSSSSSRGGVSREAGRPLIRRTRRQERRRRPSGGDRRRFSSMACSFSSTLAPRTRSPAGSRPSRSDWTRPPSRHPRRRSSGADCCSVAAPLPVLLHRVSEGALVQGGFDPCHERVSCWCWPRARPTASSGAASTAICGFGLSIVFPTTIAQLSRRFGDASARAAAIAFACAGLGGATVPSLVSSWSTARPGLTCRAEAGGPH